MSEHEPTPAREEAAAPDPLIADLEVSDETAGEVVGGADTKKPNGLQKVLQP